MRGGVPKRAWPKWIEKVIGLDEGVGPAESITPRTLSFARVAQTRAFLRRHLRLYEPRFLRVTAEHLRRCEPRGHAGCPWDQAHELAYGGRPRRRQMQAWAGIPFRSAACVTRFAGVGLGRLGSTI